MITGKKIVLTGANSGIGLETLKLLVQGNNKILAVDLKTDVISTFDQSKVFPMQCDVGNKEGIDKIFEVAKEKLGTIDIFLCKRRLPLLRTVQLRRLGSRQQNVSGQYDFADVYLWQIP